MKMLSEVLRFRSEFLFPILRHVLEEAFREDRKRRGSLAWIANEMRMPQDEVLDLLLHLVATEKQAACGVPRSSLRGACAVARA